SAHYFFYTHLPLLFILFFPSKTPPPQTSTPFPYTTLFRSVFWYALYSRTISKRTPLAMNRSRPNTTSSKNRVPSEKNTKYATFRSEEHTSELQSRFDLVCRLLLEKKNKYRSKKRRLRAERH